METISEKIHFAGDFYMEQEQMMYIHNGYLHLCGMVKPAYNMGTSQFTVTDNIGQFLSDNGYELLETDNVFGVGYMGSIVCQAYVSIKSKELVICPSATVAQYAGIIFNINTPVKKIVK